MVSPHSMFDGRTVKIRRRILSTYELLNDPSGRLAARRRPVLSGRLAGPGAPNQPRGDGGRKPPGFGSKKWEMVNISPQVTLPVPEPPAGVGRAPIKPHTMTDSRPVGKLLVTGWPAVYPRDHGRSSFLAAEPWTDALLTL